MGLTRALKGMVMSVCQKAARSSFEGRLARQSAKITLQQRSNWPSSLREPNQFYAECTRYFLQELPPDLREHRTWFSAPGMGRGFGENAFHSMWYLLLQEFKPATFLEIGVFRGQVISLVALWARLAGRAVEIWGISPFSAAGDSRSKYPSDVDYYRDTLENFDHFKLPHPQLLRAFSTDPEARKLISSRAWDMVYIDGNHDYEVARQDWDNCAANVKANGIIVLDDAGLTTSYAPRIFATAGHPGPSQLAQEIDRSQFAEILQVGHQRVFQKLS